MNITTPVKDLIEATHGLKKDADLTARSFHYTVENTPVEVLVMAGEGSPNMLGVINITMYALLNAPEEAKQAIDKLRELSALQPPQQH